MFAELYAVSLDYLTCPFCKLTVKNSAGFANHVKKHRNNKRAIRMQEIYTGFKYNSKKYDNEVLFHIALINEDYE